MDRKHVLLFSIVILLTTLVALTKPEKLVPRRIKYPNLDISGKPVKIAEAEFELTLNKPIYLNFESKSNSTKLKNLGVKLNRENLYRAAQTCLYRRICWGGDRTITAQDLIKIDQEKLNNKIDEINKDIRFLAQNNVISLYDYSFKAVSPNAEAKVDPNSITSGYISQIIGATPTIVSLKVDVEDNTQAQKAATLALKNAVTAPLLIKYGRLPVYIGTSDIEDFLEVVENPDSTIIKVKKEPVAQYINDLAETYKNPDVEILNEHAIESIRRAITIRAANTQVNTAVVLPQNGNPRSDGKRHDKYLEVVKSQQRLYRFENGKLNKTYIVSTGLTWETPPGEYEVLGKQKMTISYFNDWYMPNYLPLGTINGYRFGFHSIPYHVDGSGNIFSRDPNTMGSPATGGCIQLTEEDSKELFEWASVGTPVYIYE